MDFAYQIRKRKPTKRKIMLFLLACVNDIAHLLSEEAKQALEVAEGYMKGTMDIKAVQRASRELVLNEKSAESMTAHAVKEILDAISSKRCHKQIKYCLDYSVLAVYFKEVEQVQLILEKQVYYFNDIIH